ncbi:MAG: DUF4124 domain-containing protein [Gammaproteobacteria bacterium]|nr:DUF4124 domain-containing protein [Gammaproteobacteria bacterium]
MAIVRAAACLAVLLAVAAPAGAAEYYRYVDTNGITVISRQGVPANVIGNGYEVINEHGRVVRVVPRALTAEEHRQLQAEKEQAEIDRQLLRLYSQVVDVERAEERKQMEIDAFIGLVRRNISDLNEDKAVLLREAGNHERSGRAVPADLLDKIAALEQRERGYFQEIERYQELKQTVAADFAADRQRVSELLQQAGSNSKKN